MSRLTRKPIKIPAAVEVKISTREIAMKGPAGEVSRALHSAVKVEFHSDSDGGEIRVTAAENGIRARALSGTYWRIIFGMAEGAAKGFERVLELVGVGYRAQASEKEVRLALGFSHPVAYQLPDGVTAATPTPGELILRGADKALLGQVAADIRQFRPPEPYKGKGVRHRGERIAMKETKKK